MRIQTKSRNLLQIERRRRQSSFKAVCPFVYATAAKERTKNRKSPCSCHEKSYGAKQKISTKISTHMQGVWVDILFLRDITL